MSYNPTQNQYRHGLVYDNDRILAPVPLRRPQPVPGYQGFTARADGTIAKGVAFCSVNNSFGPPYGRFETGPVIVDSGTVQTGAFYSEAECPARPCGCLDPAAINYTPNATCNAQKRCVYTSAIARDRCSADSTLPCTRAEYWKHSHD